MCKIHSVFEIFQTCYKFRVFRLFSFLLFFACFFIAAKNKTCAVSLILFMLLSECWVSFLEKSSGKRGGSLSVEAQAKFASKMVHYLIA